MSEVFGPEYAAAYDHLYGDKNYAAECDLIERIFKTYASGPVRSVLDLGCGTGNHAIPLAQRGYEVTGIDRSEDMLAHARTKAAGDGPVFRQGNILEVDLQRRFDAVLMMFAVLGYQVENEEVFSALRTSRRHLGPQGIFVCDVWYGPAVLRERPAPRTKSIPTLSGAIERAASGELDIARHLCTVKYRVRELEGSRVIRETAESHAMRFFFPQELRHLLQCSGLQLLRLGAFPDLERDPDETTWNVLAVARAIKA